MRNYFDQLEYEILGDVREILRNTLSDGLADEVASEVAAQAIQTLQDRQTVRFLLLNSEGQLESRVLYEEYTEAEKLTKTVKDGCLVGMLVCDD